VPSTERAALKNGSIATLRKNPVTEDILVPKVK